jgi:ABC-type Zn uptake system ZnuABC Zn-binding protein ZnuA
MRRQKLGLGRRATVWASISALFLLLTVVAAGCGTSSGAQPETTQAGSPAFTALAVESFLADIAQNVAGDKMKVDSLMPMGTDPHSFEFTPTDATRVAQCDVLILNGAGLEPSLEETVKAIGGKTHVIEASTGLVGRTAGEGEEPVEAEVGSTATEEHHDHDQGDPHFWLDPTLVVKYVENIRDGLSSVDPGNASTYQANAAAYIKSLGDLDAWIKEQVAGIPAARRLLVTNHESLGYFADRYGFQIVGTIVPSVSSGASPSAQQLAHLIGVIQRTGAPAIFLETGSDPRLSEQLAAETGIKVVVDLYTHSLTEADGDAPTYIAMMKADTTAIVEALK